MSVLCATMDDRQLMNDADYHYADGHESTLWDLDSASLVLPSYYDPPSEAYNHSTIQRETSYESAYSSEDCLVDSYYEDPTQWPGQVPCWFPQQQPEMNSAGSGEGGQWEFPEVAFVDQGEPHQQVAEPAADDARRDGSPSSDESTQQVQLPSGQFYVIHLS